MQIDLKLSRSLIDQLDSLSGDMPIRSYIRTILSEHVNSNTYNGDLITGLNTVEGIVNNGNDREATNR